MSICFFFFLIPFCTCVRSPTVRLAISHGNCFWHFRWNFSNVHCGKAQQQQQKSLSFAQRALALMHINNFYLSTHYHFVLHLLFMLCCFCLCLYLLPLALITRFVAKTINRLVVFQVKFLLVSKPN